LRRSSLLVAGAFFYLLSNPLSAQIASSASFKIESVEEAQKPDTDAVDVSEFVVSTKDPQQKELLDEHPNTTHVSFHVSPDQKWIYESLSYGSRMNGARPPPSRLINQSDQNVARSSGHKQVSDVIISVGI
jgi:hypothetical protein